MGLQHDMMLHDLRGRPHKISEGEPLYSIMT
jgi:hypothetical protein